MPAPGHQGQQCRRRYGQRGHQAEYQIALPDGATAHAVYVAASAATASTFGTIAGSTISPQTGSFTGYGVSLEDNVKDTNVQSNSMHGSGGVSLGTGTGNAQALANQVFLRLLLIGFSSPTLIAKLTFLVGGVSSVPDGVVYSLVANGATTDARVMKQARALRRAGYRVIVFGNLQDDLPQKEWVEDIEIRRFACFNPTGLSVSDIEELAKLVPSVGSTLLSHSRNLFDWHTAVHAAAQEKQRLREELKSSADRLAVLTRRRKELRSKIYGGKQQPAKRGLLGRVMAFIDDQDASNKARNESLRRIYKRIVDELDGLNSRRETLKTSVKREIENEKAVRENQSAQDDIFYSRYPIFAAHILKQDMEETPQFIHCHDLYPLLGGVALAQRTGARVIFDAHEIETERVPPLSPPRKAFIDRLERDLFVDTDQIVTCCESSAEFYFDRFKKRRPLIVMNAPEIAPSVKDVLVPDVRTSAGIPESTFVVVYTGGVGREGRGLDKVVEALKLLPHAHLVILGPRHRTNDEWLLEKARIHRTADRVHFLPPVPADQVVETIAKANVGICPIQDVSLSYRYAMPNKLFEMTFARIPICVSDLPEMSRFVRELGTGEVMDQTDPRSIAQTIERAGNDVCRYQMTAGAKLLLESNFSWRAQTESLLCGYDELRQGQNV